MAGTLAIDLGSSTTVVAWQEEAGPPRLLQLAPYSSGEPPVVPSLLWLPGPGSSRPLIGRQVLEANLAAADGPGLCRDFKRRIGAATAAAASAEPAVATWLTPEQSGTLLLQRLWQALPAGIAPQRLVLTAPIEAYRGYRRWLQEACQELPVAELALVDEPTAAAIGAGLAPGSRVLVVDIGGGTIDLSLVALEGGEGRAAPIAQLLRFAGRDLERSGQALRCARVIGKAGLRLGGRDLDRWIAAALCPGAPAEGALLQAAERLKCRLSAVEEALELCPMAGGPPRELRLNRSALETLLRDRGLLARLDELLEAVLAGARREGLDPAKIDAVLPVGGGSRLPLLRAWLAERLPGVPLRGERPVEAVALGALALTPGVRLLDVLSRGVSLRIWDQRSRSHRWHPLFLAGQSWPTDHPLELVLACSEDEQTQLELVLGEPVPESRAEVVFEGGLPVLRSRPAGEATVQPWSTPPPTLPLRPPGRRGEDRLRLRFSIDADGQLVLAGEDLDLPAAQALLEPRRLGPVR
ncbi:MAG: Hsp70 family protein [Synechococcaceae cyanobacterium]|nr:Hsp70 family protein [Synechococcaceae cyanobacterium]